jgi:S1-C subfamily serine protease
MLRVGPYFAALLVVSTAGVVCAQDAPGGDWKGTATALQRSICTVRIRRGESNAEVAKPEADTAGEPAKKQASVTVCTGFCVGPNKIITATLATSDDRIRLTLAGGVQSDARLLAVDEYSGLSLLGCDAKNLTPLKLAADQPAVGEYVMAGAAWGVDRPIVSLGIIGATDRTLSGLLVPPLLQCDLRTVETSSGSPLANRQADVVGIVMAVEEPAAQRGWTYAIPVSHVRRLLRSVEAAQQSKATGEKEQVVILKRRRPIVGMVLEGNEEAVLVQRVTVGGPAEKAGVKVGDRVLAADGVLIRSAYQAVLPTLYKQPGDSIRYRVQREDGEREIEIVLGGGVELPQLSQQDLGQLFLPRVEVGRDPDGKFFAQRRPGHLREVSQPPLPADPEPAPPPTAQQKIDLLIKALERYQAVIEAQQREIRDLREGLKPPSTTPGKLK